MKRQDTNAPRRRRERIRLWSLITDALDEVMARPSRVILNSLVTAIGVGGLVASTTLAASAQVAVALEFERLAVVQASVVADDSTEPLDASDSDQISALVAVRASGVMATARTSPSVGMFWSDTPRSPGISLIGANETIVNALEIGDIDGRWISNRDIETSANVAVLGSGAAARLGLHHVGQTILIEGVPFATIGVFDGSPHRPDLLSSIVVPISSAGASFVPLEGPPQIVVSLKPGSVEDFVDLAGVAIRPNDPHSVVVIAGQEATLLEQGVQRDLNSLSVGLWFVLIVMGAITIGNSTLSSVLARSREIGLRRALGARSWHIAVQIIGESTVVGLFGATTGVLLGIVASSTIASARGWPPVIDSRVILIALVAGIAVGLVAGIHPALRAARLDPVEALRR